MERGGDHVIVNGETFEKDLKHVKEKGRGIFAMVLGEKDNSDAEESKEYKKGLYIRFFLFAVYLLYIFLVRDLYLPYIF